MDFLPSKEADLVTWSNTFVAALGTLATSVGISSTQVTAFTALNTTWINAYAAANAEATRTKPQLITKNTAKAAMVHNARQLAGIIQKFPGTTNTMRSTLGLTVPAQARPIPVPSTSPTIDVKSVRGNIVTIKLHDSTSSRRGKPAGVTGASVFSFVGATAPTDIAVWKFEGNVTRTTIEVVFDNAVAPGATVWMTAFWYNARAQSGMATTPVSTRVQGGMPTMLLDTTAVPAEARQAA